jgi:hypothetical protein
MHFLSFARKDRRIVIDADLRFLSRFILERFPVKNKAITVPLASEYEIAEGINKFKTHGTMSATMNAIKCVALLQNAMGKRQIS